MVFSNGRCPLSTEKIMRLLLNFHLLALSITCLWTLKLKEFWRMIVESADIFYVFLFPWLFSPAWQDRYFLSGFIYLSNWRLYIRNYKYCPAIFLWLFIPSASFWHSESVDNIKQVTGIYFPYPTHGSMYLSYLVGVLRGLHSIYLPGQLKLSEIHTKTG